MSLMYWIIYHIMRHIASVCSVTGLLYFFRKNKESKETDTTHHGDCEKEEKDELYGYGRYSRTEKQQL